MKNALLFLLFTMSCSLFAAEDTSQEALKRITSRYEQALSFLPAMIMGSAGLVGRILGAEQDSLQLLSTINKNGLFYFQNVIELGEAFEKLYQSNSDDFEAIKKVRLFDSQICRALAYPYMRTHAYFNQLLTTKSISFENGNERHPSEVEESIKLFEYISPNFVQDSKCLSGYYLHRKYFHILINAIDVTTRQKDSLAAKCSQIEQKEPLSKKLISHKTDLIHLEGWLATYEIMQKRVTDISPDAPAPSWCAVM